MNYTVSQQSYVETREVIHAPKMRGENNRLRTKNAALLRENAELRRALALRTPCYQSGGRADE